MEQSRETTEKTFTVTDGSEKLTLGWQSAAELPDCREVGMVAARKTPDGYEYAKAHLTCPSCWERFTVSARLDDGGRSPIRKMGRVDLRGAVIVESDCSHIADSLLDQESLGILELTGNISIDVGDGLYAVCPSCGSAFPVAMDGGGDCLIAIRNKESEVEIEDSFGRKIRYMRNGGFDFWADPENDSPADQLAGMGTLKTAVLGVSAEARHYLDVSLGLGSGMPAISDGIDLLDIAVRNRFRRSYDTQFRQDVKDVVMTVGPRTGENLHPGSELFKLPRDFQGEVMPEILAANQWPDTPEVRKAVKGRLAMAALMSYDGVGRICGGTPEMVSRVLGSFAIGVEFVYALRDKRWTFSCGMCDLFLIAAREEDPADLVDVLVRMGPSAIERSSDEYGSMRLGRLEAYSAYMQARQEHSLEEVLAKPSLIGRWMPEPADSRIRYAEPALRLRGDYGGYRFSLAKSTGFIKAMCRTSGDEDPRSCSTAAAYGESIVVMAASEMCYVALICVDPFSRRVTKVSVMRGKRLREGGKLDRAISEWADAKRLSRRRELLPKALYV